MDSLAAITLFGEKTGKFKMIINKECFISVAVCTYRRFDWLKKCLENIKNQTLPQSQFKIIVIDNSLQPDQSRAFCDSLVGFDNLEYIITDRCGIGYARTVAMDKCSTEFLAFTDDDCLVPPDWAENILKAFDRHGEGVGVIGGRVEPNWETQRPAWLDDDLLPPLGLINWGGDKDIFIDHNASQWLLTANAAYRTTALRAAGGFPPHLGRKRKLPLAQEEFAANDAMKALGYDLVYSPALTVRHFIPTARAKQKMLCRDAFWDGVSQVLFRSHDVAMDDVDHLSDILVPLQEKLITGFVEFSLTKDLKEKIQKMREAGWKAARKSLGGKVFDGDIGERQLPVIYIVTPCMNAAGTIDQTIISVLSQAGGFCIRYHIQDGGSTDGTLEKLAQWKERLAKDSFPLCCRNVVFTFASEQDQGMYDALQKGFATMSIPVTAFMAWINADDIFLPFAFDNIAHILKFHFKEVWWVGGKVAVFDEDRKTWQMPERIIPSEIVKHGLCDGLHWDFVQQEGTFFRKAVWDKAIEEGVFDGFKLAGDWNLWRVFAQQTQYFQLPWPLGTFRKHEGQLSQKRWEEYKAEIDATVSPSERRELFMKLLNQKNLCSAGLKEDPQSGRLVIAYENADALAEYYRNRLGIAANILSKLSRKQPTSLTEEQKPQESIPVQASKRPSLPPDPTKIVLGPGWQAVKEDFSDWQRWSSQSGILHLKTGKSGRGEISFSIMSMLEDNHVNLSLNGQLISTVQAGRNESRVDPVALSMRRGTNILEFSSDRKDELVDGEPVQRNFMVKDLDLAPPRGVSFSLAFYVNLRRLIRSGMFFAGYYKNQVPETDSPAEHYLLYGAWEGKNPNPLFDSAFYLDTYREVYRAGMNPLLHYIMFGWMGR